MKYLFYALLIVISGESSIQAFPLVADVSFDLTKGEIEIKPIIPVVTDKRIVKMKSTCWGLCFHFWEPSRSEKTVAAENFAKNSYFFMRGHPDALSFSLVSYVCKGPYLLMMDFLAEQFIVLKGTIKVRGSSASSRSVISGYYLNYFTDHLIEIEGLAEFLKGEVPKGYGYPAKKPEDFVNFVCTDKFREKMKAYRLKGMDSEYGKYIHVNYKNEKIVATWNADDLIDPFELEALELLKEVDSLLKAESLNGPDLFDY